MPPSRLRKKTLPQFCTRACFGKAHRVPLADRLWAKVNKNGPVPPHKPQLGPCWLYEGQRDENGYGRLWDQESPSLYVYTHRLAYVTTYGAIPDDLNVLHRCDNPPCVRPDHLFVGTQLDNTRDRDAKGRTASGANSGVRKHPERYPRKDGSPARLRIPGLNGYKPRLQPRDQELIRKLVLGSETTAGVKQIQVAAAFGVSQSAISRIVRGRKKHPADAT